MKKCQVFKKHIKKYLFFVLIFIFFYFCFPGAAYSATNAEMAAQLNELEVKKTELEAMLNDPTKIQTVDSASVKAQITAIENEQDRLFDLLTQANQKWSWEKMWEELKQQVKDNSAIAFKAAARNFVNTLAIDTATYLATGDQGQKPMFETDGWGAYLKNTADNATGTFLEKLGSGKGPLQFNLCNPDPKVLLKISLGLQQYAKPKAPACTFSKLVDNWDEAIKSKDFLPKFQDMFNPWSNDFGIALSLQTGIETNASNQVNNAIKERTENLGVKAVKDPISGNIKTPAFSVRKIIDVTPENMTKVDTTFTGNLLADAIDVFMNTLAGKLMDRWLKKGVIENPSGSSSSLSDINSQNQSEGTSGAQSRFASFNEPNFKVRGDYDILSELTTCPDPNKAGPTNCVIDEKFRQAIEKRLTVKQAMDQGYLSANGVFGFTSDGLEPKYNEGYPYRSMLILRKFRIIPVGWEVAAQYIKDKQSEVGGTKKLSDLVNCTTGWCADLVDPNWVLKAPQNYCKKEGAGPEILSEQISGEGTASSLNILRNDTYCADEQSLIKENSDGSNPHYGYCTEERRLWDFNSKSCEPRDNTCQTFQSGDQTVSYLKNTLDYGDCNAGNAGCLRYAVAGSLNDSGAMNWSSDDEIYLNKNAETCEAANEGCRQLIKPATDSVAATTVYEKIAPDYLGCSDANPPAECNNFAQRCSASEVGCELYTSVSDGSEIPAQVKDTDYCAAECVGYDSFIQSESVFDSGRDAYFIPKTAKTCSAEAAGCDQFTNLDEVAKGGEGIEYYTSLRQCVKPGTAGRTCAEFYTWEGSDESGYQLKVLSLESVSGGAPALTETYDSTKCDETIYNVSPSDPRYNADCRQFYNRAGGVFYRLYSTTRSCTDNCHPYRRTELNIDDNIASPTDCTAAGGAFNNGQCVVCKNGGTWSNDNKACIYMAVPNEGMTCSASTSGCREYSGNTGNDLRNIFTDDFSDSTVGYWQGSVTPSSESVTLGSDNQGHSILISGSAYRNVGTAVIEGRSYVLNFLAKASGAANLTIGLGNETKTSTFTSSLSLSSNWQIYEVNLTNLDHAPNEDEALRLTASANFYITNISLTEITDRYYLIKNSWQTPDSCYNDISGNYQGPLYNLGCDSYTDRAGKTHNLKSFNKLCSESAVGCELMIDTHNSSNTELETFNAGDDSEITVPADSEIYVVYDQEKSCTAEDKGCERLGKPYKYENTTIYGDVYLKNNPDKYSTILCASGAVGCQTFAYENGETYFKDPGDQICEYRQKTGAGESYGWYKKKVKRCGGNGDICLTDSNCSSGSTCQTETADTACPTDNNKTLGIGGVGGRINQPGTDSYGKWAGICSAANSGCTEYIDPVSKFNNNLIFNGSFQVLATSKTDGWSGTGPYTQTVTLEPNTVYRLARLKKNGALPGSLKIMCSPATALYRIGSNNNLTGPISGFSLNATSYENSQNFYYKGQGVTNQTNENVTCTITADNSNGSVELKKVVVDYQFKQNIDSSTCNGVVDFNKGCVLFNERSQEGASLRPLVDDADITNFSSPNDAADKDSNIILKVTPDRTCDKWLACRSYAKDGNGNNVCYDVGLCDAIDDKGDCSSFITSTQTNQTLESLGASKISNLSGYAKAGLAAGSLGGDYYPFGAMKQEGEVANLANGGFEYYGSNYYPIGWIWSNQEESGKSWDANVFSVVNNPISAQVEGIGYAPEGQSFLKLGSSYDAESEDVDVIPDTPYIITAYVNTKNLKSGQARIDIQSGTGANIATGVIRQDIGKEWQFQVGTFTTGNSTRIKIKLYSSASGTAASEGNFYFDDIKIRPALNSKNNWYTTQTCRLYPDTDSLSCDYYEDSGNRQKGWYGYCLEYDRPPGNPNACILWYPIDKVKGDGMEEGAGYQGKVPVYYCAEAESLVPLEYRWTSGVYDSTGEGDNSAGGACATGYERESHSTGNPGCGYAYCAPVSSETCYYNCQSGSGWYEYNGFDNNPLANGDYSCLGGSHDWPPTNESKYGIKFYDPLTKEVYDDIFAYCTKVVQTVTSIGDNKYWASRVYEGSDWSVYFGNQPVYQYNTDGAPFGSVMAPSANPYDWDGSTADGIQPLLVKRSSSDAGARASSPYKITNSIIAGSFYGVCTNTGNICLSVKDSAGNLLAYDFNKAGCAPGEGDCQPVDFSGNASDKLKLLFAKSYGAWQWDSNPAVSRYLEDNSDGVNWDLPGNLCGGTGLSRTNDTEYCAVKPTVLKIKVNGSSGNVSLSKNGFVNLTFNTKVDSNQLPLTMYAIDWGDDERTTVSGVEMRDRPNPDTPHSLYHLYSYWDLKAKANRNVPGIDCSTAGECKVKPKIQIKDNWGWYNKGTVINTANGWDSFGKDTADLNDGWVVVKEK